jgi:hypothetical protein
VLLAAVFVLLAAAAPVPAGAAGTGSITGAAKTVLGAPVGGAHAVVQDSGQFAVSSSSTGAFTVTNVPFGTHTVVVSAPCRPPQFRTVTVDGTENLGDVTFPTELNTDSADHVCRPAGTNFGLDPLVTDVLPLAGDDAALHIDLPFAVLFNGSSRNSLNVSTNGFVTFGAPSVARDNVPVSDVTAPSDAVYAFWDDLIVDFASSVKTGVRGTVGSRAFKIRWENVRHFDDPNARLSIELTLSETGRIDIVYSGVDANLLERGSSATIGTKGTAFQFLQQSFDTANVLNGLDVEYLTDRPPVAKAGADSTVPSGTSFPLDGSQSTDPDGPGLSFLWTQIAGPPSTIEDETAAKTTVRAVTGPATVTYRLRVTDPFGRATTDDVTVTVAAPKPK